MSGPHIDFYKWVNQAWLDDPKNQIPDEYSTWGGFTKLADDGIKQLISLFTRVTDQVDSHSGQRERQVASVWKASQDRFDSWDRGEGDYQPILDQLEHLKEVFAQRSDQGDWLRSVADYLHYGHLHGVGNVLDFDKGSNLENNEHVVLDITSGGLSLPSREYYFDEKFAEKRQQFREHLQHVAKLVGQPEEWVDQVIRFETKLAKAAMTREQGRLYDEYYTNTDLVSLYREINGLRSLKEKEELYEDEDKTCHLNENEREETCYLFERLYELFDFRKVMCENLEKNFPNGDGPDVHHITAYDGDGIRRTVKLLLDSNNREEYLAFLQYEVISSYKAFCTKELDEAFFDFYGRKLSGQAKQKSNEKRSVASVNGYLGELAGQLYVDEHFSEKSKEGVVAMVDNILAIMRGSINQNDWLTSATKKLALEKLEVFRVKIGYPDKWIDYSQLDLQVGDSLATIFKKYSQWAKKEFFYDKINSRLDREKWEMTPQTVNAYYHPIQNEIVFPAAILQPPFFHKEVETVDFDYNEELGCLGDLSDSNKLHLFLSAVNLGGIGSVIAHEITHGYDDQGRKFDGEGKLRNWWTEEDVKLFEAKTELMVKQAEQYVFQHPESGDEYRLNPHLTMGENLADLGGMSLALQALIKELEQESVSEEEKKNLIRIFFKSVANIEKTNIKTDSKVNRLITDPHSPAEFRSNLIKNIDHFYTSFDVKEGDPMHIPRDERLCMW